MKIWDSVYISYINDYYMKLFFLFQKYCRKITPKLSIYSEFENNKGRIIVFLIYFFSSPLSVDLQFLEYVTTFKQSVNNKHNFQKTKKKYKELFINKIQICKKYESIKDA